MEQVLFLVVLLPVEASGLDKTIILEGVKREGTDAAEPNSVGFNNPFPVEDGADEAVKLFIGEVFKGHLPLGQELFLDERKLTEHFS